MAALRGILFENKTPIITWFGPKPFVIVDHPDDICTVMNAKGCVEKADIYRFLNRGTALLAAPCKWSVFDEFFCSQLESLSTDKYKRHFLQIKKLKDNDFI